MNKRKILLLTLTAASVVSIAAVTFHNRGILAAAFDMRVAGEVTNFTGEYTFTLTAGDIANGYLRTPTGATIPFESSKVSADGGLIKIEKNGYIRFTEAINGTTSVSIDASSFSDDDKLMVQSGYKYNDYGAANYLSKSATSAQTYFRTHLQFTADKGEVRVNSITVNYTCAVHYDFAPIMESITQNVNYGNSSCVYHYAGLTYEEGKEPNLEEVNIGYDRFDLDLSTATVDTVEPAYSIHPIAKFYDKGGCLIKQVEGFWLCHVNPIIRFFTGVNKFESFTFTKNDSFNLGYNSPLYSGVLSGYDWSDYTKDGGVLTKPLTTSFDLYPKVIVNVNPGAYTSDTYHSISFVPNKNTVNYGFPSVANPTPKSGYEAYKFTGWYNGEEKYDPAKMTDFHDYDLYAEYNSEYDLRIKFQNRGFNNPYLEIGVPNHESRQMPAEDTFIDQTTTGNAMGEWIDANKVLQSAGYWVYPQGKRDEGRFYAVGESFTNDNIGTTSQPAVYIAEPYVKYDPDEWFVYFDFEMVWRPIGSGVTTMYLRNFDEHKYWNGKNDTRTYFKKVVIPDWVYSDMPGFSNGAVVSPHSAIPPLSETESHKNIGLVDTKELEVVVGNEAFDRFFGNGYGQGYGFMNNAELRKLIHFPSIRDISPYTFYRCPKLEPLQNWTDFGPVKKIEKHAFDSCFINPIIDASGNISRRRFEIPTGLHTLEEYAFAKAVYTDFYIGTTDLTHLTLNSFAYSTDGSHSADFAAMKAKFDAGQVDEASLKAVANHVYFDGTLAEFEALTGTYNELEILKNKEYYVTFNS